MGEFPNKKTQFSKTNQPKKKGRPKGSLNMSKLIRQMWEEIIVDEDGNPRMRAMLSVKAMMEKAQKGDTAAYKALTERLEGMPRQEIDFSDKTHLHKDLETMTVEELEAEKRRLEEKLDE